MVHLYTAAPIDIQLSRRLLFQRARLSAKGYIHIYFQKGGRQPITSNKSPKPTARALLYCGSAVEPISDQIYMYIYTPTSFFSIMSLLFMRATDLQRLTKRERERKKVRRGCWLTLIHTIAQLARQHTQCIIKIVGLGGDRASADGWMDCLLNKAIIRE